MTLRQHFTTFFIITVFLPISLITACSQDGKPIHTFANTTLPQHPVQVIKGNTYTFNATSIEGEFSFLVYDSSYSTSSSPVPLSQQTVPSGEYQYFSFIAPASGTVYLVTRPTALQSFRYTVDDSSNHLTVGAMPQRAEARDGNTIYYSFHALEKTSYEVQLQSLNGNVDIGAVSGHADMSASVGSSRRAGAYIDRVGFTANSTGIHYIRVDTHSVQSGFSIAVNEISPEPDLEVILTRIQPGPKKLRLHYTVFNNGIQTSPRTQLAAWGDLHTVPQPGQDADSVQRLPAIAAYQSVSGSISVASTAGSGTAYLSVDHQQRVIETKEDNNITSGMRWGSAQADLQVVLEDVYSDGENVSIGYRVSNTGALASSACNIEFWSDPDTPPVNGDSGEDRITLGPLKAGESTYGTVSIPSIKAAGTAYALVDSNANVAESDETNNVSAGRSWEITFPDLQIALLSVDANGNSLDITYQVSNGEANFAQAFNVDFFSDASGAPVSGLAGESVVQLPGLAPGESIIDKIKISSAILRGTAYAIVDTGGLIAESDESNNVSNGVKWLVKYPDLQVAVERVVALGSQATVTLEIYNRGLGYADSFSVGLWLDRSAPPPLDGAGEHRETFDFSAFPLMPGAFITRDINIENYQQSGTAYAVVDNFGSVVEGNELNNISPAKPWSVSATSDDLKDTVAIIPDNDPITGASATITLSHVTTSLSKAVVGANIWHESLADINVYLESPSGTTLELFNGATTCVQKNYGYSARDTIFDDDAQNGLTGDQNCSPGEAYRPLQPLANLAGEDANGTWTLRVYDKGNRHTSEASLRNFSLQIY